MSDFAWRKQQRLSAQIQALIATCLHLFFVLFQTVQNYCPKRILKQLPPCSAGWYSSWASCACNKARDKGKPIPEPLTLVVKNGIKICSATSGAIPGQLSVMSNCHCSLGVRSSFTLSCLCSLCCIASIAFCSRLISTCSISPSSSHNRAWPGKSVSS